jgi:uncharacterized protein (TIGR02145 family)
MTLVKLIFCGLFAVSVCKAQNNNNGSTVKDIDGNVYHTVKIGNQVWTVENLRTTTYRNGYPITLDTASATWSAGVNGKYCYYGNTTNTDSIKKYGALYSWFAIESKMLAPEGWRVPTNEDWEILEAYLIENGFNWDGTKTDHKYAKSLASKTDWLPDKTPGSVGCDLSKNNGSGFSALPGGNRYYTGLFGNKSYYGYWWSASDTEYTIGTFLLLPFEGEAFDWLSGKAGGYSVRVLQGY